MADIRKMRIYTTAKMFRDCFSRRFPYLTQGWKIAKMIIRNKVHERMKKSMYFNSKQDMNSLIRSTSISSISESLKSRYSLESVNRYQIWSDIRLDADLRPRRFRERLWWRQKKWEMMHWPSKNAIITRCSHADGSINAKGPGGRITGKGRRCEPEVTSLRSRWWMERMSMRRMSRTSRDRMSRRVSIPEKLKVRSGPNFTKATNTYELVNRAIKSFLSVFIWWKRSDATAGRMFVDDKATIPSAGIWFRRTK